MALDYIMDMGVQPRVTDPYPSQNQIFPPFSQGLRQANSNSLLLIVLFIHQIMTVLKKQSFSSATWEVMHTAIVFNQAIMMPMIELV